MALPSTSQLAPFARQQQRAQTLQVGTINIIHARSHAEAFRESFHQIVDVKLNKQQTALAILLADGLNPEGHTCILKNLSDPATAAPLPGVPQSALETLRTVQCVEWMQDGQGVVYTRVDPEGHPVDACLHLLGTKQAMDRVLYDEARLCCVLA